MTLSIRCTSCSSSLARACNLSCWLEVAGPRRSPFPCLSIVWCFLAMLDSSKQGVPLSMRKRGEVGQPNACEERSKGCEVEGVCSERLSCDAENTREGRMKARRRPIFEYARHAMRMMKIQSTGPTSRHAWKGRYSTMSANSAARQRKGVPVR